VSASDALGLLGAVARFLEHDARPALQDPALAFRARIAAALLRSIAAEAAAAESLEQGELARLRALVRELDARDDVDEQEAGPASEVDRRAALHTLEQALCDRVRAGLAEGPLARVRASVREGLRARLAVTTPEFDLSAQPEAE
jgi:hypothetical protein